MSTLTDNIDANFALFIEQTQHTQLVWGLKNEDGWLACDSTEYEHSEVMPFWSSQAEASAHNVEEWADFEVVSIPLDVFVEDWLITLAEDQVLVGINWNQQLEGKEVEPQALAQHYIQTA